MSQRQITQHKRFALRTNSKFFFAKASFMLGTSDEMAFRKKGKVEIL